MDTRFFYVTHMGLEIIMYPRITMNSQEYPFLSLWIASIDSYAPPSLAKDFPFLFLIILLIYIPNVSPIACPPPRVLLHIHPPLCSERVFPHIYTLPHSFASFFLGASSPTKVKQGGPLLHMCRGRAMGQPIHGCSLVNGLVSGSEEYLMFLCVWVVAYKYVCKPLAHVEPSEARTEHQVPWHWSYRS